MDSFIYEYPTKVYLGEGLVSKELKNAAKVLGNKVLITYGGSSAKKNGTLDEVLSILKRERGLIPSSFLESCRIRRIGKCLMAQNLQEKRMSLEFWP